MLLNHCITALNTYQHRNDGNPEYIKCMLSHLLVLNIGTSSQISIVVNQNTMEDVRNIKMKYPSLDVVPYMDDDVIITAASLTG